MNEGSDHEAEVNTTSNVIPTYVAEIAISGRAECRKCELKIGKNELRIGVMTEGDWGKSTIHPSSCIIFIEWLRYDRFVYEMAAFSVHGLPLQCDGSLID
jgi:hypothetical protein